MQGMNPDAFGVAALSIIAGLVFKLVESGVMTKEDAIELYGAVASAKGAKGLVYDSVEESGAALLAATMRAEIEARY